MDSKLSFFSVLQRNRQKANFVLLLPCMDTRKQQEAHFHDVLRDEDLKEKDERTYKKLTANKKFYAITRASDDFIHGLILTKERGKKLLDYCCGNGGCSVMFAKHGVHAVGIDISETSIENGKKQARNEGVADSKNFL